MIVGSGIFLWSPELSLLKTESLQKDAMPTILTNSQLRKKYPRTIITKYFVSGLRVAKMFHNGAAGKYSFQNFGSSFNFHHS